MKIIALFVYNMLKKIVKKNSTSILLFFLGLIAIMFREIGFSGGGALRGKNAIVIGFILIAISLVVFLWDNFQKK